MRWQAIVLVAAIMLSVSLAYPPLPTDFYGSATIYDSEMTALPAGTQISVYAFNVSCGSFDILDAGYYGSLTCLGDDDYTGTVEGAIFGQNILFYINGEPAQVFGDTVWYNGVFHNVNITPMPACPNTWCEITETCVSCAADCGFCPPNMTGNFSGNGTGGGSGGGGSPTTGDTGSSSGRPGETSGGSGGGRGGTGGEEVTDPTLCQENWVCTDWRPEICPPNGRQTRRCNDINACHTNFNPPSIIQSCEYIPTCNDTLKNQDETDIDCGGAVCDECLLNQTCLFDSDCVTEFCNPNSGLCEEPSCSDGFRNQGESGIDCGGPCESCEKPVQETPETILRFIIAGCGPFPWPFLILASLAAAGLYWLGRRYIKSVKLSKGFRKKRKLERILFLHNLKRNLKIFNWLVLLLETIIALYLHFYCDWGYFLLIASMILIPSAIAIYLKYYVYDERRFRRKLRHLDLGHEDRLETLIKLERRELRKDERKLYERMSTLDYKALDPNLSLLLKDVSFLLKDMLLDKEHNYYYENELADTISELDAFKETMDADEEMKSIYSYLKLIEKIRRDILVKMKSLRSKAQAGAKARVSEEGPEDSYFPPEKEGEAAADAPLPAETEKSPAPAVPRLDYNKIAEDISASKNKEELIGSLLKENPGDLNLLFIAASSYHHLGDLAKAQSLYDEIIAKDPSHKHALYYKASLHLQKRELESAFETYKTLMQIDPEFKQVKQNYNALASKLHKT
ncbi:MAG: hypothetical protein HGA85_00955 [Nanoarchaeota archaeon]|nr:hypothetical protein [Nanoarchaeota archaeon]